MAFRTFPLISSHSVSSMLRSSFSTLSTLQGPYSPSVAICKAAAAGPIIGGGHLRKKTEIRTECYDANGALSSVGNLPSVWRILSSSSFQSSCKTLTSSLLRPSTNISIRSFSAASSPPTHARGEKGVAQSSSSNLPESHDDHGDHHYHDPRSALGADGCRRSNLYTSDEWHWPDEAEHEAPSNIVMVNGQKMIRGHDTFPMEMLYTVSQANVPIHPRTRMFAWINYPFILKAEFLFFWIPTAIIFSIAIPCFTLLYMMDEAVFTTMTIKVIGRQWYWVYEVESPPLDDVEEE